MSVNPHEVYRGRHSRHRLRRILLYVLAGLLAAGVVLFYAGQKYIVYTPTGLRVIFPIMEEAAPEADAAGGHAPVQAEIVYEDTGDLGLLQNGGETLQPLQALYLPAGSLTPDALTAAGARVKQAGGNALVLQMKAPNGMLSWKSGVQQASAYAVNGTAELGDALQSLKADGIYLVAVVSTCVDTLMAERYSALALCTADGVPYTDSLGGWLDPYSETVRGYLTELGRELAVLGFDEIAFSLLQMPFSDAALQFPSESATRESAVAALGKHLRNALMPTGVHVSAVCSADSVLQEAAAQTGQALPVFTKLFDRLYVFADAENLSALQDAFAARDGFAMETRFVPCLAAPPQSGSWVKTE